MTRDASLRVRPRYVERGGDIVFRHPFVARGVRMHNFVLEADPVRIEALLDRTLNDPSGHAVHYRPMGTYVVLNFVRVDRLASHPPDDRLGSVRETEAAIWVPCVAEHAAGRVLWTVPYMFVDSGTAMASGREVFGYPKQLGDIKIEEDANRRPRLLKLKTLACREFSPSAVGRDEDVVTVRRGERDTEPTVSIDRVDQVLGLLETVMDSPAARHEVDRLVRAPSGALRDPAGFARTAYTQVRQILHSQLSMVFLKQFRSAEVSEEACYQALVEVPHSLSRFGSFGVLPEGYEVTFHTLDSQPIARELGLRSGVQPSRLSYRLEFDFIVNPGRVVWRAI